MFPDTVIYLHIDNASNSAEEAYISPLIQTDRCEPRLFRIKTALCSLTFVARHHQSDVFPATQDEQPSTHPQTDISQERNNLEKERRKIEKEKKELAELRAQRREENTAVQDQLLAAKREIEEMKKKLANKE